uniref:Kinesin-like protein KIFC3-like n=1 Tax=Saccoglossus kowalevskii TaxID=10224 RepID=A0ABM0M7U7_SACKO|nr:PREDICTED: kinesin-like protein KIFC3-like [Saccoglossus kowalevskii]
MLQDWKQLEGCGMGNVTSYVCDGGRGQYNSPLKNTWIMGSNPSTSKKLEDTTSQESSQPKPRDDENDMNFARYYTWHLQREECEQEGRIEDHQDTFGMNGKSDVEQSTFHHEDGTIYNCIIDDGQRYYFDSKDEQVWKPFPSTWLSRGTLVEGTHYDGDDMVSDPGEGIKTRMQSPSPKLEANESSQAMAMLLAPGMKTLRQTTKSLRIATQQLKYTCQQHFTEINNLIQDAALNLPSLNSPMTSPRITNDTSETELLRSAYRLECLQRKSYYNKLQETKGNIRVFCRCRQLEGDKSNKSFELLTDQEVICNDGRTFKFDKVFPPFATQQEVFDEVMPLTLSCIDGYSLCVVGYGQSDSGTTYTLLGTQHEAGIGIRAIGDIFKKCSQKHLVDFAFKFSMVEIYNDCVYDLLGMDARSNLTLLDDPKSSNEFIADGVTKVIVKDDTDVMKNLIRGIHARISGITSTHSSSCRSHLLIALQIGGVNRISGVTSNGSIAIVDLACTETIHIGKGDNSGQSMVESTTVHKSFMSLQLVLKALRTKTGTVPFNNSVLTQTLRPFFGPDAKVCFFATVNPEQDHVSETLNTLEYASTIITQSTPGSEKWDQQR